MFVERLKDYLNDNGQDADEFLKGNYFECNNGCVGEDYIGDDILQSIIDKFYYPFRTVADVLQEEVPKQCIIWVYVQPSYEDRSVVHVILYDKDSPTGVKEIVIHSHISKAWNFIFVDEDALEREMQEMYDTA